MKFRNLVLMNFALLLTLEGCNTGHIETGYNDFRKTQTCTLKRFLLSNEWGRRTEGDFQKLDDNNILCFINMSSTKTRFKEDSHFLFKIHTKSGQLEEIILRPFAPVKSEVIPIRIQYGTAYVNESSTIIKLAKEQFLKLANAEKVEVAFETYDTPIRGELNTSDIQMLRDFAQKCLGEK